MTIFKKKKKGRYNTFTGGFYTTIKRIFIDYAT